MPFHTQKCFPVQFYSFIIRVREKRETTRTMMRHRKCSFRAGDISGLKILFANFTTHFTFPLLSPLLIKTRKINYTPRERNNVDNKRDRKYSRVLLIPRRILIPPGVYVKYLSLEPRKLASFEHRHRYPTSDNRRSTVVFRSRSINPRLHFNLPPGPPPSLSLTRDTPTSAIQSPAPHRGHTQRENRRIFL